MAFDIYIQIWMVNVDISYSLYRVLFMSVDVLITLV